MIEMKGKIRVLVVDDSKVMRKLLVDILQKDKDIEVVGTGRNGEEAVAMTAELKPDVVTMDIEMPKMDGLAALERIMTDTPTPVVMLSAMDKRQADITMKALAVGAVDFIPKTSGTLSLDIDRKAQEILTKVKVASEAVVSHIRSIRFEPIIKPMSWVRNDTRIVVIGASTGGPMAILDIISRFPREMPAAFLIVQHMPRGFTASFAERMNWFTSLEVREAREGDDIKAGTVLIAPGDIHMEIEGGRIKLNDGPKVNYVRPSIDVLMRSAAKAFGPGCIAVLLTGMGADGAEGMMEIKKHGGRTIAQNKATCVIFGMPKAAIDLGAVDAIVPLDNIAAKIIDEMGG